MLWVTKKLPDKTLHGRSPDFVPERKIRSPGVGINFPLTEIVSNNIGGPSPPTSQAVLIPLLVNESTKNVAEDDGSPGLSNIKENCPPTDALINNDAERVTAMFVVRDGEEGKVYIPSV